MRLCRHHWDKLREQIEAAGLGKFVAQDGIQAASRFLAASKSGTAEAESFEPMLSAFFMITERMLALIGRAANPSTVAYLLEDDDAPEDPIVFDLYRNGRDVRIRLQNPLDTRPVTWPRCPLCYANLAHELNCDGCGLPAIDGYDIVITRAVEACVAKARELGLKVDDAASSP